MRYIKMWAVILCILAIGIFTTRMTRQFVGAEGEAEMAALALGEQALSASAYSEQMQPEEAAEPEAEKDRAVFEADAGEANAENEAAGAANLENTDPGTADAENVGSGAVNAENAEPGAADTEKSDTEASGQAETGDQVLSAYKETVKSPLEPDPGVEGKQAMFSDNSTESQLYGFEELENGLSEAEKQAEQGKNKESETNPDLLYAMSERERLIWDRELSKIAGSITGRMTPEEADDFQNQELEWLKERERAGAQAAEERKASGHSQGVSGTIARMTRERCYYLLEEYEELLKSDEIGQ